MSDLYSDDRILVYVDVDEEGNITEAEIGRRIIPSRQYQYFFITDNDEILLHCERFKVIERELVYVGK